MEIRKNRMMVALSGAAAVLLLLGAFTVVWLMPRGESGSANVQKPGVALPADVSSAPSSSGISSSGVGLAPISKEAYSPSGAPYMAPILEQPHISVRGNGVVSAKPDMVNLQVGVQIQNASLDGAQTEAATKADAIVNQLKAAGIEEKDISTAQYNVEPVMNYRENEPPTVTGFRVTNIMNVKVRDITKAGKLIDDMVKSGANTIYGLSFSFSDPTAVMKQAREQAMNDAKAKAQELASLGGVALGAPIVIDDGGANVPPIIMDQAMNAGAERSVAAMAPPINPGQQEIRVDVTVIYAIK